MKRFAIAISVLLLAAGCGEPETVDVGTDDLTKEEARNLDDRADYSGDFCEDFGWYGDGICDDFCPEPDPDCGGDCDDGSDLHPLCDIRPACEDGEVSAVQNGCFVCVDAITCEPAEEPADCDDGSAVDPLCDIREGCPEGQVSAVQNGCFVCVDPATCEPADQDDSCGGIAGLTCDDGEYCSYSEDAMCGAADQLGTCEPQPDFCTQEYAPVCGCDGNTYSNDCHAAAAGVSVASQGACGDDGDDDTCGGIAGLTCDDGEYCSYAADAMCGAADQTGTCKPRPDACITLYDPVCGCDGSTYSNSCMAASAGVSVASEGPCN